MDVPVGANVDLEPLLMDRERFADAAERAADANGVLRPRTYRSPALTFFDAIAVGRACAQRPFGSPAREAYTAESLPEGWRPLWAPLSSAGLDPHGHAPHRGPLVDLARALDSAGVKHYKPQCLGKQ